MRKAFSQYKQKRVEKKAQKAENKKLNVNATPNSLRAAIFLHGCGEKDGTDVVESTSLLIALSQHNAIV